MPAFTKCDSFSNPRREGARFNALRGTVDVLRFRAGSWPIRAGAVPVSTGARWICRYGPKVPLPYVPNEVASFAFLEYRYFPAGGAFRGVPRKSGRRGCAKCQRRMPQSAVLCDTLCGTLRYFTVLCGTMHRIISGGGNAIRLVPTNRYAICAGICAAKCGTF